MQRAKKWAALLLMMSLSLVLAGCAMPKLTLDPEELYALPELPARYTTLNQQLNAIQESSAEYAAPVSGSNIQPVQMVDLDGDGREEALAFFRQSDGEKPLKIYVFTDNGNSYTQTAVIEGSGLAVYSIAYSDMNGDGRMEIIVGWRVSMDLQALTVYALEPGGARGAGAEQLCQVCRGGSQRRRDAGADGVPGQSGRRRRGGLLPLEKRRADLQLHDPGVYDHGGIEPAGQGDGGDAAFRGTGSVCYWGGGRDAGNDGCSAASGRGTEQCRAVPYHRRVRGKLPVPGAVSRGYQRGRRDRGTPHGSPVRRGTGGGHCTAGGLDQL